MATKVEKVNAGLGQYLDPTTVSAQDAGFVYFLAKAKTITIGNRSVYVPINLSGEFACKIGYTKRPISERIRELQTGQDIVLVPIVLMENVQFSDVEREIHNTLKNGKIPGVKHVHGEWYQLSLSHIDAIVHTFRNTTYFKEIVMYDA
jgi:hypothetical protein